jgi:hypothetical protein
VLVISVFPTPLQVLPGGAKEYPSGGASGAAFSGGATFGSGANPSFNDFHCKNAKSNPNIPMKTHASHIQDLFISIISIDYTFIIKANR